MTAKVVVITGASSGIGAALAELVAKRRDAVVLVARRQAALEDVARRCGGQALAIPADMTVRTEVKRAVAGALERFGRIDVWVNNAGQGITRLPTELSGEDLDEMIRLNVKTALYGMQEVLPHFVERRKGHVINISSMLGRIPARAFRAAYNGAKHFLNALTENFRTEVQERHPEIQFSLVSPGVVRTNFGANALYGGPDSRQLPDSQSAEDVARVIVQVIDSRRPDVYTRPGSRDRVLSYFAATGQDP